MADKKVKCYAVCDAEGLWWDGKSWTDNPRRAKLYPEADRTNQAIRAAFPGQMVQPVTLTIGDEIIPVHAIGWKHAHPALYASGKRLTVLRYAMKLDNGRLAELDADSESEAMFLTRSRPTSLVRIVATDTDERTEYMDRENGVWCRSDGKAVANARTLARVCPMCGCSEFLVTAHVAQDWRVDSNGNFIECVNECDEVDHAPDDSDVWTCAKCGFATTGGRFLKHRTQPS